MLNWLSALTTSSYSDWLRFCMGAGISENVPWSKSGHLSSSSSCAWLSFSGAKSDHGNMLVSKRELVLCSSNPNPLLPLLPVLLLLLGLLVSQ
ncbi:Os01g0285200 [Oryza sativa Japonica Group]|uniref:Os01g0285200 protein n=3 Tax=Oryza TaxID=4527 RepID=C7IWW3_ORYSJ|nr:Os01g0285200 [Oryza sativa Japonica Group]|eukprot:NP_001172279.1 Os01g0285200 [Oryza sativa Japonica Group]